MARAEYFFTYRLTTKGRTLRIGKGGVAHKTTDAAARYLVDAYGVPGWDGAEIDWHSNEGAAFKAERQKTDTFQRATGGLPPWNAIRGGSGGAAFVSCRAFTASGERCLTLALSGNYGFCGVHRRL